jgi:hypothetical protein
VHYSFWRLPKFGQFCNFGKLSKQILEKVPPQYFAVL